MLRLLRSSRTQPNSRLGGVLRMPPPTEFSPYLLAHVRRQFSGIGRGFRAHCVFERALLPLPQNARLPPPRLG